ncbi:uncharacterized protein [Equus caballus]|uniref:uncharacterized protein isoform X3 n=1 Tax=Equus caballus TaxID=9796 RepID=UPI0038B3422F
MDADLLSGSGRPRAQGNQACSGTRGDGAGLPPAVETGRLLWVSRARGGRLGVTHEPQAQGCRPPSDTHPRLWSCAHALRPWNLCEKMDSLLTFQWHQGSLPTEPPRCFCDAIQDTARRMRQKDRPQNVLCPRLHLPQGEELLVSPRRRRLHIKRSDQPKVPHVQRWWTRQAPCGLFRAVGQRAGPHISTVCYLRPAGQRSVPL